MHFYIGEGGEKTPAATAQPGPEQAKSPPKQVVKSVIAAPKAAPTKPTTQPKTARKAVDYWIQTGSYKSQSKAEELVTLLAGKGLNGRVFSSSVKNVTYYRVRIGPYGNKDEAGKFLSIVKQIQGLESSYISQVSGTRIIN